MKIAHICFSFLASGPLLTLALRFSFSTDFTKEAIQLWPNFNMLDNTMDKIGD